MWKAVETKVEEIIITKTKEKREEIKKRREERK